MNAREKIRMPAILIAATVLATACADSTMRDQPAMDMLVTPEWLAEHLDDPDLVLLDCTVIVESDESGGFRSVSGRSHYEAGHILTAG